MDPIQMAVAMWRHKVAVIPVILLTALGLTYVTVLAPATYEVTASYVLVPPPYPPSPEDVRRDPALADVRADNPFVRLAGPSVIVDLAARRTDSGENREALLAAGADERFQVVPSNRFGFTSPIIDINAVGSTPESTMKTARLVSKSMEMQLRELQAAQNVDDTYMYKPLLIDLPETPRLRISNKLRSAVAILVLGGILTLIVVSAAEALTRRPVRGRRAAPEHLAPAEPSGRGDLADSRGNRLERASGKA